MRLVIFKVFRASVARVEAPLIYDRRALSLSLSLSRTRCPMLQLSNNGRERRNSSPVIAYRARNKPRKREREFGEITCADDTIYFSRLVEKSDVNLISLTRPDRSICLLIESNVSQFWIPNACVIYVPRFQD